MKKLHEDSNFVYYEFKTSIYVGLDPAKLETKYGFCKFNKKTEEFELDTNKSDPYFLAKNNREVIKVQVKLIQIKRSNQIFPDITGIATG